MTRRVTLSVDTRAVVHEALERGIAFGVRRWLKYRESPLAEDDEAALRDHLERELVLALDEVVRW